MFRKLQPDRSQVVLYIDGVPTLAESGESVAAVLLRQAHPWSGVAAVSLRKRAPYCMMGVCFECIVEVNGVASIQSCLRQVEDGMRVVRQGGRRSI